MQGKLRVNACLVSILFVREAENKEPVTDFSTFLPYFIWVLRDFSMNLNGKTPV